MPTEEPSPIGITAEQVVALLADRPGITAAEVARALGVPPAEAERHLAFLETRGSAERAAGRGDGDHRQADRWTLRSETFGVDRELVADLLGAVAADRGIDAGSVSLADFSGEWLAEQLADLLDRAQDRAHQVLTTPRVHGAEVRIVAYPDDAGLILALRYDPLFIAHGAQIDGGWEAPSAYIPMRTDGTELDLADVEGILTLLVERANALLPVLAAALSA